MYDRSHSAGLGLRGDSAPSYHTPGSVQNSQPACLHEPSLLRLTTLAWLVSG